MIDVSYDGETNEIHYTADGCPSDLFNETSDLIIGVVLDLLRLYEQNDGCLKYIGERCNTELSGKVQFDSIANIKCGIAEALIYESLKGINNWIKNEKKDSNFILRSDLQC